MGGKIFEDNSSKKKLSVDCGNTYSNIPEHLSVADSRLHTPTYLISTLSGDEIGTWKVMSHTLLRQN